MAKYTVMLSTQYEVEVAAENEEEAKEIAVAMVLDCHDTVSTSGLAVDNVEELLE